MAVYKEGDTGKWRGVIRSMNWKGERKQTQKRGFLTKRDALNWEREAMLKQESKLDMIFASFFEIYEMDKKKRVKENTWESKSHVILSPRVPIVDGLIFNGTYLFSGAKSRQIFHYGTIRLSCHVSMGIPLWGFPVTKGTVYRFISCFRR